MEGILKPNVDLSPKTTPEILPEVPESMDGIEESSESSNSSLASRGNEEANLLLKFDNKQKTSIEKQPKKTIIKKSSSSQKKKKSGRRRTNWALLPNSARSILRKWLRHHLEYPYPTEKDKKELIQKTHLTPKQISNWFAHERHKMSRTNTTTTLSGSEGDSDQEGEGSAEGSEAMEDKDS